MLNINLRSFKLIGALFLFALLISSRAFAYDLDVSATTDSLTLSTADSQVKTIALVVSNPNGELVFSKTQTGKRIVWALAPNSVGGHYKYQVTLSNVISGSRSRGQALSMVPKVTKHSGSVSVQAGKILPPNDSEEEDQAAWLRDIVNDLASSVLNFMIPAAHADQIITDDLISIFSMCVGADCVDGENFGGDTIRLKENNLRMHFNDTSNSAAFPGNDWRFLFNDTSNGGSNFFSLEDATAGRQIFTVDAGAPSNSLYVGSSGNIGLGTSTPATALDMTVGNSPTIRFTQDASLGFTAQSWDLFGNEEGFFLRDFTGGASLPLSVAAGAPTNAFVVNGSGNVGLGIDSPTEALHVMGNAIISGNLELGSSRFIKHKIQDLGLEQAMAAVKSLEPVMFNYNHSPNKQSIGFIAEDVPDLVATDSRKSLQPMDIVAVLTKVVQEQQKAIEQLSETVEVLLEAKKAQ